MEKEELIQFENEIVELFNDGKLRSPVHLSGGNEKEAIEIFKQIKPNDWVFSTYRGHYHALLHGISKDWLKQWILNNKSIHVMNNEHKFWTSAIVGGTLSIALGVAISIKLYNDNRDKHSIKAKDGEMYFTPNLNHVWVFIGEMTATTGQFWEVWNYAFNHDLPMTFVIEDNGLSTDTPTREVWNKEIFWFESPTMVNKKILHYKYTRIWPHYGTGKFISKLWEKEDVKAKGF